MSVKSLTVGYGENTYIIEGDNGSVVIDPGAEYERILSSLEKPCKYVLLTHAHYDHIGAVSSFQKAGAAVYLHESDLKLIEGSGNLCALFGESLQKFTPNVLLHGGETLELCGNTFNVLHTPGHTEGSVCYIYNDIIFSGDTLFKLSVGRTDFPSGSSDALTNSILNKLFTLNRDYNVYPGHGEPTTLFFEKSNNPYV